MDDQEKKRQEEIRRLSEEGWEEMQEEEIGLANLSQEQLQVRLERIDQQRQRANEKLNEIPVTDPAYDRILKGLEELNLKYEEINHLLNPLDELDEVELDPANMEGFSDRQARMAYVKRLNQHHGKIVSEIRILGASLKTMKPGSKPYDDGHLKLSDLIDRMSRIQTCLERLKNPRTGITRITIENFKGISAPVTIPLRPITLLFGANSAGKSTILQSLHYARELLERNNANADTTLLGGGAIELGGFRNIVHRHDLARPIRIRLDITPTADGVPTVSEIIGTTDQETDEVLVNPEAIRSLLSEWSRESETIAMEQEKMRHDFQNRLQVFWNTALPEETGGSQSKFKSGLEQALHRIHQVLGAEPLVPAPPESWLALRDYLVGSLKSTDQAHEVKLDATVIKTHVEALAEDLKTNAGRVARSQHFLQALRQELETLFKTASGEDASRLKSDYRTRVESDFQELMNRFMAASRSRYGAGSAHLMKLRNQLSHATDSSHESNINPHVETVSMEMVSRWDPDRQLAWFAECNFWINGQVIISLGKAKPAARPSIDFIDYFHPVFSALDENIDETKNHFDEAVAEFLSELHGSLISRLVRGARIEKLGFDVVRSGTGEILIGRDQALNSDLLHKLVEALPDVTCRTNAAELFPQARLEIEGAVKRFEEKQVQLKKDLGFYPLIQLSGREELSPHPEKPLPFRAEALGEGREHYYDLVNQIVVGITNLASQQLKNFRYIGPIREIPDRDHEAPQIADPARWADGQGAWDLLLHHYDAVEGREVDFVEQVSKWFEDPNRLDLHYRIEVVGARRVDEDDPVMTQLRMLQNQYEERSAQDFRKNVLQPLKTATQKPRIRIVDMRTHTEVGPKDIGIGVAQSLPIVVGALDNESKFLAVEQPELHLHPVAQACLGDIFAAQTGQDRVFLIETHSETLMLRIFRRIRETTRKKSPRKELEITKEDVSLLYISVGEGGTKISPIRLNDQGKFVDPVPGGFFEEGFAELF